ncbi:TetR/AcrR family transcriptional regulator [Burkholderia cenocepacia]|jgi:TetR/AcrR family transcriptional repressor of nem operon
MEFDRSEAVKRAVDVFWERGYGSISANELAERMGIGKSSFYNTFGSKVELLREAVGSYADVRAVALRSSVRHRNVMEVLRALLVDVARRNDDGRGCLLVNTSIELSRHDEDVAHATRAGFDAMTETFEVLVAAGQRAGHILADVDAKQQARILVTSISGLRVMVQSGFTEKEMVPFIDTILKSMAA